MAMFLAGVNEPEKFIRTADAYELRIVDIGDG